MTISARLAALGLACLTGLIAALPAASQQQPPPRRPSPFAADARLNKPITIRWVKRSLGEAVKEVATATGVKLTVARTLADEPVMASERNVPAGELLVHMAELLHFTWGRTTTPAGVPSYELFQNQTQRDEEQAEIDGARRQILAALNRELERLRQVAKLPQDQIQKLLDKSEDKLTNQFAGGMNAGLGGMQSLQGVQDYMALQAAASPTGRLMLDLLAGLTPAHWAELQAEEPLVFSSRPQDGEMAMPGGYVDRLRNNSPEFPFSRLLSRAQVGGGEQAPDMFAALGQMMKDQWSQAVGYKVTVVLMIEITGSPVGMLRVSPEPISDKPEQPFGLGSGALFGFSGVTIIGTAKSLEDEEEDPVEREKRLSADPVLGKKALLKLPAQPAPAVEAPGGNLGAVPPIPGLDLSAPKVGEVLPYVEDAFGIRLLSDAYSRQAIMRFALSTKVEQPLFKVLDAIAGTGRRWELVQPTMGEGPALVWMKSKTWAHDRRAEIPERLLEQWAALRKKQGGFSLDDLAVISLTLRDEQVENLTASVFGVGMSSASELMMVPMSKGILRLWGRLQPQQKRALLAGQPVGVRSLTPVQQQQIVAMRSAQNKSVMAIMTGAKPRRSAEQLLRASLVLERGPGGAGAPAGAQAGATAVYNFALVLPGGGRDQYTVMALPQPTR